MAFLKDKLMNRKVFNEKTRALIEENSEDYTYGVVYASEKYIELGWFKLSPENIMVFLPDTMEQMIGISREALPELVWSNKLGFYIPPYKLDKEELFWQKTVKGQGNFPYRFAKRYEAADSFKLFKGAQKVLNDVEYPLAKDMSFTFGLEFETSMGYVPQELCFRDGLIPLRDGSISGIEYSTVVLEGNKGLNLLHQQLETLKTYTKFNKECALHIHMGGFPVSPTSIFALYCLWCLVEKELLMREYVPRLTFNTALYKANKKDYCNPSAGIFPLFEDLFEYITGKKYLGSLVQPHPADIEKKAKWNIKTRYFGLNLVNMLCYKGPKTVEFRFLRPTFNYRKITLWLYILNAVLKYAKTLSDEWTKEVGCYTRGMFEWISEIKFNGISDMLAEVYDESTYKFIMGEIRLLRAAVRAQTANGDQYGRDIEFEEELFT